MYTDVSLTPTQEAGLLALSRGGIARVGTSRCAVQTAEALERAGLLAAGPEAGMERWASGFITTRGMEAVKRLYAERRGRGD